MYLRIMSKQSILTIVLFILLQFSCFGQTDTIYFNAEWKPSSKTYHNYYRIIKISDEAIGVTDYYKNGIVQMTGQVVNSPESKEALTTGGDTDKYDIGAFNYYNQDGSIYSFIDYSPDVESLLDSAQLIGINPDSLVLEKTFYSNGQTKEEGLITVEGKEHGKTIYYTKKEVVIYTAEFNNGILDGLSVMYYTNGEIKNTTEYKNGVKHGEHKGYGLDFELKITKTYENGNLKSTVKG